MWAWTGPGYLWAQQPACDTVAVCPRPMFAIRMGWSTWEAWGWIPQHSPYVLFSAPNQERRERTSVHAWEAGDEDGAGVLPASAAALCLPLPLTRLSLSPPRCKELKYSKELPQISIIFIFVNEALSVILRSVHSAVNHTPTHLLKEIILVDDNSDEGRGWRLHASLGEEDAKPRYLRGGGRFIPM